MTAQAFRRERAGRKLARRLSWLLRGSGWRGWHVYLCQRCWRRFADNEPGCIPLEEQRFPRLCHCPGGPWGSTHWDCKASGPYCPPCASKVAQEQAEIDEYERQWNEGR